MGILIRLPPKMLQQFDLGGGLGVSLLRKHGIERTPENIRAVEAIVRDVPPLKDDVPEVVQRRLEDLGKALIRADLSFEDILPVRFIDDGGGDPWFLAEKLPLAAIEALHAFYCEQTGKPDAKMRRRSGRDAQGRKQATPALRFVTECLQTRNPKIAISAVEKAFHAGLKSKAENAV